MKDNEVRCNSETLAEQGRPVGAAACTARRPLVRDTGWHQLARAGCRAGRLPLARARFPWALALKLGILEQDRHSRCCLVHKAAGRLAAVARACPWPLPRVLQPLLLSIAAPWAAGLLTVSHSSSYRVPHSNLVSSSSSRCPPHCSGRGAQASGQSKQSRQSRKRVGEPGVCLALPASRASPQTPAACCQSRPGRQAPAPRWSFSQKGAQGSTMSHR